MGEQVRRENEAEAEKVRQKLALGEECRICYKTIESDPYNAQCEHMFHRQCVQKKFEDVQMTNLGSRASRVFANSSVYRHFYPQTRQQRIADQYSTTVAEQERIERHFAALRASKHPTGQPTPEQTQAPTDQPTEPPTQEPSQPGPSDSGNDFWDLFGFWV